MNYVGRTRNVWPDEHGKLLFKMAKENAKLEEAVEAIPRSEKAIINKLRRMGFGIVEGVIQ